MGTGGPGDHEDGPGSYMGHMGHELEHNRILPQIGVGKDISTTIVLSSQANLQMMTWLEEEDARITGKVFFFHQDGTPMPVRVNGQEASSEFAFQVNPSEMVFLEITSDGPNTPGWSLIAVDDQEMGQDWGMRDGHAVFRGERLIATAFYTVTGAEGELISRVGVIPAMYERDHFFNSALVALFGENVNTGVAIVNTNSETVPLQTRLIDSAGQEVAVSPFSLPAGNQTALFIDQLFPGSVPESFQGSLEVTTSEEGVVVMGLLMTHDILTSMPAHHFGNWEQGGSMMP
ncbi:MAG: hypothetical protein ACE5JX_14945 [Acidobacteriota bacterium]